jgi:ribonuclease-3
VSASVVVFRTHSDIEASIVRGLLDSHGVQAFLSSDIPHAIFPLSVNGLGEVRVSVSASQADDARRLIEAFRRDDAGAPEVIPFPDDLAALEAALGYRFRDRGLLDRAVTHRSKAHEEDDPSIADNESLEFLGDAVLGFIVADLLFREFPEFDEGQKSKVKAALVSRASLADIAERMELGAAMRLGRGEEKTGGRQKDAVVADACEAVIAALYLDGGLEAARAFLQRELAPTIERVRRPGLLTAMTGDYKSALQEWLQARSDGPPLYRLVAESGPDHRKSFAVDVLIGDQAVGRAEGRTKKEAEQGAARAALIAVGALDG